MLSGNLIDGHVLIGKSTGLILANSREESLNTFMTTGHPIVEIGKDSKFIPVGVDVFKRWAGLVVLAVGLWEEPARIVPQMAADADQTPRIGIQLFPCPTQLALHQRQCQSNAGSL